jgi:hypothetical protein
MWLNRPAAAVACYERALAAARGIAELYINKGTALVALNRHEDALESFAGMRGVNGGNQIGNRIAARSPVCSVLIMFFSKSWR